MRFVRLENCTPGMVLGKSIYAALSAIFLRRDSILTQSDIEKLAELGYVGVYIRDEFSEDIEIEEVVDPVIREQAGSAIAGLFNSAKFADEMKRDNLEEIESLIHSIVAQILENRDSVVSLASLKTLDNYTYQHSVDVGILSLIMGREMKLSREELLDLGRAAFFHDIGKVFVSSDILSKVMDLTPKEFDEMKKHSDYGYTCLATVLHQPVQVAEAALYHHERYDGGGYPKGISRDEIPLYSRIIAVADVYDAITSNRSYRGAFSPSEAYEHIMSNMGTLFAPEIVKTFIKKIAPFPVGTSVSLSDGRKALVVKNNPNFMMRPFIKILYEKKHSGRQEYIDLAHDLGAMSLTIVSMV